MCYGVACGRNMAMLHGQKTAAEAVGGALDRVTNRGSSGQQQIGTTNPSGPSGARSIRSHKNCGGFSGAGPRESMLVISMDSTPGQTYAHQQY